MDAQQYNAALVELRGARDDIKKAEKALEAQRTRRHRLIQSAAKYDKAKAERLAPASGLSVKDIVELAPHLAPQAPAPDPATPTPAQMAAAEAATLAPAMTPVTQPRTNPAAEEAEPPAFPAPQEAPHTEPAGPTEAVSEPPETAQAPAAQETTDDDRRPRPRELPTIPDGAAGDRWCTPAPNLLSTVPPFTQQVRPTVFLDTTTGDLIHRDQRIRLDLGRASADEILTAVFAHVPDTVERIYITAGAPWHLDTDRYAYLKDAVQAWLAAPMRGGWKVESGRGRDRLAGHFLHERNPVGRWERGEQHIEVRSINEWFDPEGADVAIVREAFTLMWRTLKREKDGWPDVVLMGSPSQTGRDLWTRTIPTREDAEWRGGYPVMSEEIRQLLHATSGQGRTELITPPRLPQQLPGFYEFDRTLAYGKHTWSGGVGAPRRVTARTFASWSEKEQTDALFAPSHWQIRVTVPDTWNHVGILPFAVEGDRSWTYPHEAGRSFVTWAGGAEVNIALRNPIAPWKIEILDGLLWKNGSPLREWADKLKSAWSALAAAADLSGTPELRQANKLASRGVRSILLYGIGGFAQRPTVTTGSVPIGSESEIPPDARVMTITDGTVTWERSRMTRNPNAHPEWSAGIWSAARAALLSTRVKPGQPQLAGSTHREPAAGKGKNPMVHVGVLHQPPGTTVAFNTDSCTVTTPADWPYNGEPGDYKLKGMSPGPVAAPTTWEEFRSVRALSRSHLKEQQSGLA
ncbi:Mucin-19 [Streptomyces microflavus]|uniref:Mucin-19 n=1 Tax=Streptomyces microflavus TaxID=1919 RepID=UPI0037F4FF1F